ncbi:uncharacterized protein EDB91DRAFT_1088302 [Suillus paluster]|uniref:uncharacterized protein n=1 Tax=Suillus paluster TaxID=48578 RepID=UPI001B86F7EE|nr:uncharacterized protein EDB91DRAFT_1088302 [Suillus paluster]KAG1721950.1 hypothetical protein EDB91DRAFT_1088302 [Suillus paluster]
MSKRSAPTELEHDAKRVRFEAPSALKDPAAWDILERWNRSSTAYLGDRHRLLDWTDARLALFSGDDDNELSLSNLLVLKRKHIPPTQSSLASGSSTRHRSRTNKATEDEDQEEDDDEEEEEDINGLPRRARVTPLPAPKHTLSDAIDRIEENVRSGTSSAGHRLSPVSACDTAAFLPTRMYVFTVHVTAREFLAEHLEKAGFSVVVSPWIPAHLYVTSDSPLTILSALPEALKVSIKKWDRLDDDEANAVNALRLKFPHPAWLRIKRGKYKDAIAYVFDSEQTNSFVTVLVPPREFPYEMPKGSVALFDPSRLPTGISTSDIIRDGQVVGSKYKGEEYYGGLLKKNFHRYCTELVHVPHPDAIRLHLQSGWDTPFCKKSEIAFSKQLLRSGDLVRLTTADLIGQMCTVLTIDHAFGGSVKLQFDLDGRSKEIEARVDDVERVFAVGDEVRVVAGTYLGLEGHVVQKDTDIFHICQSGTQEQVEVSKFYLDRRPIDLTLQGHMSAQPYLDPPQEPKTVEIGDYVQVLVGDWIGKSGMVQWASDGFIWFQDEDDLLRNNDRSGVAPPFMQVAAAMVERTRLPATLKFTKERGYDVRPGDVVSVARGPEFRTQGVVRSVDFRSARLTLETDNEQLVTVPIQFVTKTRNADLDAFNKCIKKEVFVIGGPKKGFRATLYDLSADTCTIAVHGQPRMTARRCDVATMYGCRLNGAMLEWNDFTSFCEMRRQSFLPVSLRSVTPPPEKTTPSALDPGSSVPWVTWSPEVLAAMSSQTENAGSATEDPWTFNASDAADAVVETTQPKPRDPICWLKEYASQFHRYHALFNVSAGFQGGKLLKRLAYSHSPDPFCGPNGLAPPGHISAWCTAKTAGGARVDYQIPVEFLTPAQPRKKNQECFIMNGSSGPIKKCTRRFCSEMRAKQGNMSAVTNKVYDKKDKDKESDKQDQAKIRRNQTKSKRGFDPDIKHPNSKKIAKIKQNEAKSERGFDLGLPVTPDEDKDKQYNKKDYDGKNQENKRKTRTRKEYNKKDYDTIDHDKG